MQLYDTMSNENPIEREKFSIKMEDEMLWKHTLRESDKKCRARPKKKKNVVNLDSVTDYRQTDRQTLQ